MAPDAAGDGPQLPPGYRLRRFDDLDSTNDEAKRQAAQGAPNGTVIVARRQTAGRGRRGRGWESPEGNLYATLLLRPDYGPQQAAQLSFVTALALADTVRGILPAKKRVELKWPNDVLVKGRKISGILLEAAPGGGGLDWVVIGCGINIVSHPKLARGKATSLMAEGASPPTLDSVLEIFLQALHGGIARWQAKGFAPVREDWLTSAHGVGQSIVVRLPGETLRGTFAALDENGALELELAAGGQRLVTGGEVYFGRDAEAGSANHSAPNSAQG
ncbi:MAG: biotin--[acetyl-CoA-carboxylase] ligase [Proteobacteria bacterium]|nr:biotin--[acetyl-CoA-carboxylase] ligase [Pseudomonadota bacterium]